MNKSIEYRELRIGAAPALPSVTLAWRLARRLKRWQHEIRNLIVLLRFWQSRARARRQLRSMSDHLLKDIGVSRYDAETEGRKRFWQ